MKPLSGDGDDNRSRASVAIARLDTIEIRCVRLKVGIYVETMFRGGGTESGKTGRFVPRAINAKFADVQPVMKPGQSDLRCRNDCGTEADRGIRGGSYRHCSSAHVRDLVA